MLGPKLTPRVEMLRDRIATDAALFDVETKCGEPDLEGWYSLACISDMELLCLILESAEFLEAIGRLERHPGNTKLIRPCHAETVSPEPSIGLRGILQTVSPCDANTDAPVDKPLENRKTSR